MGRAQKRQVLEIPERIRELVSWSAWLDQKWDLDRRVLQQSFLTFCQPIG